MAASSFRDILLQFLEEKSDNSATAPEGKPAFSTPEYDFHWQSPQTLGKRRSPYPAPTPRPQPVKTKPAPKPLEREWDLSKFSITERECVTRLVDFGAFELRGKKTICRSILKSAHRRLVKLHHPDVLVKVVNENERARRKEIFLKLQSAFETLDRKLSTLNARASDSESASESASPHQDAA